MEKMDEYIQKIEVIEDYHEIKGKIKASVIIVTYKPNKDEFKELYDSLDNQTTKNFEVIIIDNGSEWRIKNSLQKYDIPGRYIRMKKNYGPCIGRNIGAKLANGEILIFLDDDGIPRKDFVEKHILAYDKYEIVALRGKIKPKGENIFNKLAKQYDLGDDICPFPIDAEGNSSFKKEKFMDIGGFNEKLGRGHEGNEITYRLIKNGVPKENIIYYPKAVLYHDYTEGFTQYVRKKIIRHKKQDDRLIKIHPDYPEFKDGYFSPETNLNLEEKDRIKVVMIDLISTIILILWDNLRN